MGTNLMVNGDACDEAVALARENPKLGVGLHLSLVCGRAALPPREIPGLVNATGHFSDNPVATGFRYFANRSLAPQLRAEIAAQWQADRRLAPAMKPAVRKKLLAGWTKALSRARRWDDAD